MFSLHNLICVSKKKEPERIKKKIKGRVGELSLDEIFSDTVNRELVPSQMLRMAKKFGLTKQDISEPNWRAAMVVEACNTCEHGGYCFMDRKGRMVDDSGIDNSTCPNLGTYKAILTQKFRNRSW